MCRAVDREFNTTMKGDLLKIASLGVTIVAASVATAQSIKPAVDARAVEPDVSRQEIEAYARTNKAFARAIEYFVATMDGRQPEKLPEGVTGEDILNAVRKVFPTASINFDQAISFYGKAVDENNRPVAGAQVRFQWEGLLIHGKLDADVVTDREGLFCLTNKMGTLLRVSVGKPDYYASRRNRGAESFRFAGRYEEGYKPERDKPVIYYFQKKGVGADSLITSQYGVSEDYQIKTPLNGTKVNVDLLQRKTGSGPLEISQVKPEYAKWKSATAWSFTMRIPDGGFIEESEEFAFTPPASGYQPVVEFKFQTGQTNWTTSVRQDYYIKFGNPPVYGQLHLETSISSSSARIVYIINPDGSRNLEPKQGHFPSSSSWTH